MSQGVYNLYESFIIVSKSTQLLHYATLLEGKYRHEMCLKLKWSCGELSSESLETSE